MGTVRTERDDSGILTLWLDNPGRLNALSNGMVRDFCGIFPMIAADDGIRVVLLRGHGGAFCAGRDLNDLMALQQAPAGDVAAMYELLEAMSEGFYTCPIPVIAVVERVALGIGAMLALWADVALAADDAIFGFPEVRHGVAPYGAVPATRGVMTTRAMTDLLLTGRKIGAAEAATCGIVTRSVPVALLETETRTMLDDVLAGDDQAIRRIKAFMRRCERLDRGGAIAAATREAKATTGKSRASERIAHFMSHRS